MNHLGIAHSVVFPFESSYYPLFGEDKPLDSPSVSKFPYEKENRNLFREVYDIFPEYAHRLLPFAMFDPSRDTGKQAENLKIINGKYRIFGLKTVTTYIKSFVKDFQKTGNSLRDFAYENQLPVTFHCSWVESDIWANVFDVLDIVRICIAHTARFSRRALDRAASLPNCFVDTSAFKIHCDLAVMDSPTVASGNERFEADYSSPADVMRRLSEAYPETMIWGSDTPYHYFMQKYMDGSGKLVDHRLHARYDDEIRILKSLPEKQLKNISNLNTQRYLFGLDR
jgi:predicted TIM-barrel fold metal-dependent hydrolase